MSTSRENYVYTQIRRDIEDNIWGGYRLDKPYLIQAAILTNHRGVDGSFKLQADRVDLPTKGEKYIVYTIGAFAPYRIGIKSKIGTWYQGHELNRDGLIIKFFYDTLLVDPAKVWFFQDYDESLYLAVKVNDYPKPILRDVRLIVNTYLNLDDEDFGSTSEPMVKSLSTHTFDELKTFEGGKVAHHNGHLMVKPEMQVYVNGALLLNGSINDNDFMADWGVTPGTLTKDTIDIVVYKDSTFLGSSELFSNNEVVSYTNMLGDNKYWIQEPNSLKERIVSIDNNCLSSNSRVDLTRKFFYKLDCEFYLMGLGAESGLQYGIPIFPYTDYSEIRNLTYTDFGISVKLIDQTMRRGLLDFDDKILLNQDDPITGKVRVNDLKNKLKSDSHFIDNLSEIPIFHDENKQDRRDLIMKAPDDVVWGDLSTQGNNTLKVLNFSNKEIMNVGLNAKRFLSDYKPYSYFGIMETIGECRKDPAGNLKHPLISCLTNYSARIVHKEVSPGNIVISEIEQNPVPILHEGDNVTPNTATDKVVDNLPIRLCSSLEDLGNKPGWSDFENPHLTQYMLVRDLRGPADWVKAPDDAYIINPNGAIIWQGEYADDTLYTKYVINTCDYGKFYFPIPINSTKPRQAFGELTSNDIKGFKLDLSEITDNQDRQYAVFPTYNDINENVKHEYIAEWRDIQVYLKSGQRLIPGLDFVYDNHVVYLTNIEYLTDGEDNGLYVLLGNLDFWHSEREFPRFKPRIRTGWIKDKHFFDTNNDDYFYFLSTYSDLYINGEKMDETLVRGANEDKLSEMAKNYNGKPFMIVPKRPYIKDTILLDICGQVEKQAYAKLEELSKFVKNVVHKPTPNDLQVIQGTYGIVSLFLQTVIDDLKEGRLQVSHSVLTNSGAAAYLGDSKYKRLLDIDPALNRDDLEYVTIYPTFYEAVELKKDQYTFLSMINQTYFNGVVNLADSISIIQ